MERRELWRLVAQISDPLLFLSPTTIAVLSSELMPNLEMWFNPNLSSSLPPFSPSSLLVCTCRSQTHTAQILVFTWLHSVTIWTLCESVHDDEDDMRKMASSP